jgi:NAD-dependent deacetylase
MALVLPADLLDPALGGTGPLVFLTGAGISAESGIPTFRGPEGYWRVGSRNYQPMELATREAFEQMPEEVWRWYLHRRAVCQGAQPNAAHLALVKAESLLRDRFLLVTQNVDGLHLRAGNSGGRTFEIHGNIDFARCLADCGRGPDRQPLPVEAEGVGPAGAPLPPAVASALHCPCGGWLRPHVLWFDESYDERRFRFTSTLTAMDRAAALVVIGTSGATNLPTQMCERAAARGIPFLVLDPEPTTFARMAERCPHGHFLRGAAGALVPALVQLLGRRDPASC